MEQLIWMSIQILSLYLVVQAYFLARNWAQRTGRVTPKAYGVASALLVAFVIVFLALFVDYRIHR